VSACTDKTFFLSPDINHAFEALHRLSAQAAHIFCRSWYHSDVLFIL
jgi:hypothetical protein